MSGGRRFGRGSWDAVYWGRGLEGKRSDIAGGFFYHCNWRDKSVSDPGQRLDISRLCRGIVQRVTKFFYRGIQAVLEVNKSVHRPQLLLHLLPCNHFAGSF